MEIKGRKIGKGFPTYIIAEMSANHAGDISRAKEIICAAKEAGADCIKIQTYTPDNYSIVAAQKQDYEMFYDDEISFRKLMGYPPVMHMLEVKISSKNEENLEKSCDDMKKFSDMAGDKKLFITGPVVPQVYKLNDIYTQVLYVKAADYERLTQFKDNIEVHVKDNILYKNVSVQFNFD